MFCDCSQRFKGESESFEDGETEEAGRTISLSFRL